MAARDLLNLPLWESGQVMDDCHPRIAAERVAPMLATLRAKEDMARANQHLGRNAK